MATKAKPLPTEPQLVAGQICWLPIELLVRDESQPRVDFNTEALQDLADNIKARGIKHPIVVRSDYVIEDGERRWRAAQIAGLATVPCILAAAADEQNPGLERAMDQVAQNSLREPLNPMEWARFFLRLRNEFGLTVEQMADTMAERGIKMSRPYISNLMRLAALPDWAQTKISAGELTAAHGKVLLTAQASPKVLGTVRKEISREGAVLTTDDLQNEIFDAFDEHHIRLDHAFSNAPAFNTKQCNDCEHCASVSWYSQTVRFCLNKDHFDELQAEATKRKDARAAKDAGDAAEPKPPKQPKLTDGVYKIKGFIHNRLRFLDDAKFDTSICESCEWKHPAAYSDANPRPACFNIAEFEQKQKAAARDRGRLQRVAELLDSWAREQLRARLEIDKALQFRLLSYLAIGGPGSYGVVARAGELALAADTRDIAAHIANCDSGEGFRGEPVLMTGLELLDRDELYHFARYAGVELNAATYRIDAAYVDLCKKADIARLIAKTPLNDSEAWATAKAGKLADMKAFALTDAAIEAIGVPADVAHIWSEDVTINQDEEEENEDADSDEA